jgi:DNA-binding NtrC family response regulator
VGGSRQKTVDVRVIAATNRNLFDEVQKGRFREDLFFRLHVVYLSMPPLRDRKEDIPLLVDYLLSRICERNQFPRVRVSGGTLSLLERYDWPGNVRELQNVLESSLILSDGETITPDCLPTYLEATLTSAVQAETGSSGALRDQERVIIIDSLTRNHGNISRTARVLGISRTTLYAKLDQMGIERTKVTDLPKSKDDCTFSQ